MMIVVPAFAVCEKTPAGKIAGSGHAWLERDVVVEFVILRQ